MTFPENEDLTNEREDQPTAGDELVNDELLNAEAEDEAGNESPAVVEKASQAARKLEPTVLAHVLAANYQPVKPRVIAKQLKLPSEQHRALKLAIRRLVKSGQLSYGAAHVVRPPQKAVQASPKAKSNKPADNAEVEVFAPDFAGAPAATGDNKSRGRSGKNLVTGKFRRAAAGFGFVRPLGAERGDKSGDIFISAHSTMDAADRDIVEVRIGKTRARGPKGVMRQAGEIVRIVERDTFRFVGTYRERQGVGQVQVDGSVFANPIPVGDPGAKGAAENDKVVIEMVRFPTHMHVG
ncbi:MAG: ribonuclease R, partial [Pirellulaceae bacterium]|nr:ribonuclease R [Pirellulaceae bacterium]